MKVDAATARRLAVEADVDPRTIARVLRGESVRTMARYRARAVLQRAGLLPPEPPAPAGDAGGRP